MFQPRMRRIRSRFSRSGINADSRGNPREDPPQCDPVPPLIEYNPTVPILDRSEQRVSPVVVSAVFASKRDVLRHPLVILLLEAAIALLQKVVPAFERMETITLVLDDQSRLVVGEAVPCAYLLRPIVSISVTNRILHDFADLLLEQIHFLEFRRSFLNDNQGEVADLAEIARKLLIEHPFRFKKRAPVIDHNAFGGWTQICTGHVLSCSMYLVQRCLFGFGYRKKADELRQLDYTANRAVHLDNVKGGLIRLQ